MSRTEVGKGSTTTKTPNLGAGTENRSGNSTDVQTNPYTGTRFEEMYNNNPYAKDKRSYNATWLDKFVHGLGFQSGEDIYNAQQEQAYNEYNAQIAQLASEDKYNSAEEQAQRLREAGINPDLAGGVSAGEAGEFAMEQGSPDVQVAATANADRFKSFAEELIGTTMQLWGIGKEIPTLMNQWQSMEAENATKLFEGAKTWLTQNDRGIKVQNVLDEEGNVIDFAEQEPWYDTDLMNSLDNYVKQNFRTRRQQEAFKENVIGLMKSTYGRKIRMDNERAASVSGREAALEHGNKYTGNQDFIYLWKSMDPLIKLQEETLEKEIKIKNEQARKNLDYEQTRNGVTKGEAENAENEATKLERDIRNESRNAFQDVMRQLDNYQPETAIGNFFYQALRMLLPSLFMRYLN